jgi:hypothetical protein
MSAKDFVGTITATDEQNKNFDRGFNFLLTIVLAIELPITSLTQDSKG